jgi:hypothetical protein
VRTGIEGDNGDWQVMAIASDDDDAVLMLSLFPQKCPTHRRAPCAELLTRINFGMMMGCFEMDYDSGKNSFQDHAAIRAGRSQRGAPGKRGDAQPGAHGPVPAGHHVGDLCRNLPRPGAGGGHAQAKGELRSGRKPSTETQEFVHRRFMNN